MDTKNQVKQYTIKPLLQETWKYFTENFKTITTIVLIVYIPINIIVSFVPPSETLRGLSQEIRIMNLLEFFIGIIATLAIAHVVNMRVQSKEVTFQDALKKALSKWPVALLTTLIAGLCLFGLTLLLIIPGIIFGIYWLFTAQAVILSDKSYMEAMKYSKQLVQNRWWVTCWFAWALAILTTLAALVIGAIFWILPDMQIVSIISNTSMDIVYAFMTVAYALLYLNFDATQKNTELAS